MKILCDVARRFDLERWKWKSFDQLIFFFSFWFDRWKQISTKEKKRSETFRLIESRKIERRKLISSIDSFHQKKKEAKMSLWSFGSEQLENGSINDMLQGVGISDVSSFVNQFRGEAVGNSSVGWRKSFQFCFLFFFRFNLVRFQPGASNDPMDMIQGAVGAYKTFSGSSPSSSGGFLGNLSEFSFEEKRRRKLTFRFENISRFNFSKRQKCVWNVQEIRPQRWRKNQSWWHRNHSQRNGSRSCGSVFVFRIEQNFFQRENLFFFFRFQVMSKALFRAVDQNGNGQLDFTDVMALMTMLNRLASQYGVTPP